MENKTQTLILRYEMALPTLNEYIEVERINRNRAALLKKAWTQKVKWWTLEQCKIQLRGLYDLDIVWYRDCKRHDADNVYFGIKFLLDGIVAAGVLPGDDRKVIRDISNHIRQHKSNVVEISFIKV